MSREIKSFPDVTAYMDNVELENPKDAIKLNALILKLAEKGEKAINGRTIKQMKGSKPNIIQIEIIRKKYRIHSTLTLESLHLVHAFDKKTNKTPPKHLTLSINRAKKITQPHHDARLQISS